MHAKLELEQKKMQGEIKKRNRHVNCYGWNCSCVICNPPKFTSCFLLFFFLAQLFFSSAFRRSPPSTHIGLFANIFWFIYYQSMPGDEIVPLSSANFISSAQELLCWQHFPFPWHGRKAPPGQFILSLVHITFSNCH